MAQHLKAGSIGETISPKGDCLFSIETVVTARMVVMAADEGEAREILNALLGGGRWQTARTAWASFAIKAGVPGT